MGRKIYNRFVCCLLAGLLATPAIAAPLAVPDSARPGAVRPEKVDKSVLQITPPSPVLEVPAVIDRPFETEEGPRVAVNQFRFVDTKDMPEYDIKLVEVQERLQVLIAARPEGFTIGQLSEAAEIVRIYYAGKGLILAQAVIPVQTVQDGIVDIQIFEGKLGRVLTEGNKMYSDARLQQPFKKLIGKPVHKDDIESILLALTDFPGLTVFGIFQPGQTVGTADIVLNVQEEERFDVSYRLDNHGLQSTGRIRFRPTIVWNNPTGAADRFSMTIQQTYHPKLNVFKAVDYDRYLGYGFRGGGHWQRNIFDVGGELAILEIHGETKQAGVFLEKSWIRSRIFNLSSTLGFTRKESATTTSSGPSNLDKLSVFTYVMNLDRVDQVYKGLDFATLELSHGVNDLWGAMGSNASANTKPQGFQPSRQSGVGNRAFAAGQFTKVWASASRLQTIKPGRLSMVLRAEFQWSDDLLVPLEQYSVGGPDNLRAFPSATLLLDRALFLSSEFIINMPFITDKPAFANRTWGELVSFSLFFDYVVGRLNEPLSNNPQGWLNLKGAGAQARLTLPGTIDARVMWAWEVDSDVNSCKQGSSAQICTEVGDGNGRSPQIWGDLTYSF